VTFRAGGFTGSIRSIRAMAHAASVVASAAAAKFRLMCRC